MKLFVFIFLLIPAALLAQNQNFDESDSLAKIPFVNGQVIYEKVFTLDSINDNKKVFNAAKAALIRNTNYKYEKIDEDRDAGNISTNISYAFAAKPGIATIVFNAKSLVTIDVKENRFRVRLLNNVSRITLFGTSSDSELTEQYLSELKEVDKKKWKLRKSVVYNWHKKIETIIEAFGILIADRLDDDF